MERLIQKAFDTSEFREKGHKLIDQLADHLSGCAHREDEVLRLIAPDDEYRFWKDYKIEDVNTYFKDIIDRNIHVHHKHYIGHQVAAPAPLSALAGLVSDLLNDGMGIYEMGAAATAIERVVIEEFTKAIGYTSDATGFLTSGGTLANLTALLAARAHFYANHTDPHPVILVSDQAHYCIERAAMTMGMTPEQLIKIPSATNYTIDLEVLKTTLKELAKNGQKVMAIVACACSTSTGSYDNLPAVAKICSDAGIWMHIDGAHGGAVIFSKKYRHLADGFQLADSIIIDAHKMMMTPALATAVLFKKHADSYRAFNVEASYLFEGQDAQWHNLTKRTYETTKYMMAIKVFLLMRYYGLDLFDQFITSRYDLALDFAALVTRHSEFELGHQPMSNIVCFRFSDIGLDQNEATRMIRQKLLEEGKYYIVQTTLQGEYFFRITIMSPYTTIVELEGLLATLSQKASELKGHQLTAREE